MKAEDVDFAPVVLGAQLDTGDDAEPESLPGRARGGDSGDGVMVGKGNRGEAGRMRGGGDGLGGTRPVGRGRVHVEVDDARHGRRSRARADGHGRYPASGEVLLGCEYVNSSRSFSSGSSASAASRERVCCGENRLMRTSRASPVPRTNIRPNSSRSSEVMRPLGRTCQVSPLMTIERSGMVR